MGAIEVDMFSQDVDSPGHPVAESFKELLEEVAGQFDCSLLSFEVNRGTITFSFDSDELTAEILKMFEDGGTDVPDMD